MLSHNLTIKSPNLTIFGKISAKTTSDSKHLWKKEMLFFLVSPLFQCLHSRMHSWKLAPKCRNLRQGTIHFIMYYMKYFNDECVKFAGQYDYRLICLAENQYALFKFRKHSFKRCQGKSESEICAILPIQILMMSRLRKTKTSLLILAKIPEQQNTTQSTILVGVRFIQLKQYQMIAIAVFAYHVVRKYGVVIRVWET